MARNNDRKSLDRFLSVSRRRCEFVEGPQVEAFAEIAEKAFPGLQLDCEFVAVRSDQRLCEYRKCGESLFVVIDLELSDRLMELDLLAQFPGTKHDFILTFATVLLGDVFRRERDFRRYRYSVLKASGDADSLRTLSSLPKDGPPVHAAIVPILLHEIAHVVYRLRPQFVQPLIQMARIALDKFAAMAIKQAETGERPIPAGTTIGIPFEQYDQARLKEQLEAYANTVRNNPRLTEELACDFIAALAFVNLEGKTDCFRTLTPASMSLSPRQLGDIYYLSIKTSRYIQFLVGLQQFGANASAGTNALNRSMIEITARTNCLTFLLTSVFGSQLDVTALEDKPRFTKPLSHEQMKSALYSSIAQMIRMQHEKLLQPFDLLMEFHLDRAAFDEEEKLMLARECTSATANFEDVDRLRSALPL